MAILLIATVGWSDITATVQTVLHAAARLFLGLHGRTPVSSAIHDTLHWLTYSQRVTYKLCLLTYNVLLVWCRTTCRAATRYSSQLLDALSFVLLKQTSSSSRSLARPLLGRAVLPSQAQLPGINCRSTRGTSTSLWPNLDKFWKLHCFRLFLVWSPCAPLWHIYLLTLHGEMSVMFCKCWRTGHCSTLFRQMLCCWKYLDIDIS